MILLAKAARVSATGAANFADAARAQLGPPKANLDGAILHDTGYRLRHQRFRAKIRQERAGDLRRK